MSISRSLLLLALAAAACGGDPPAERLEDGSRTPTAAPAQVASSSEGVVAAGHPLAAQAGARMLEQGGNAVDAAVAAAFALSVVEPTMSGLGGRAQILIRLADGTHVGIDGTTQAPATYDPDTAPQAAYGYPTVGVPGVPAALLQALETHGTLPRATVMEPAITLAEDGFDLLPNEAARQASAASQIAEFVGTTGVFLTADGSTRQAGDRFVQPDLARTLRVIADGGADAFYRGPIAQAIAADMEAHGGALTLQALDAYRAEPSEIVRGSYRGHDLIGLWVPSYGAITIEILQLLETLPLADFDADDWAVALSEAIRVGYLDRPNQHDAADAERLTSKRWAAERAPMMRVESTPAGVGSAAAGGESIAPDGHTTHLTTADRTGMVVSLTQSLGPNMGSRVVTPGLGFLYAATLGGYLGRMEPGERARSHISPFMVESDGAPFLALGAAGGGRIPTAIVAVVSRIVDQGMTLADALRAPRIVPEFPRQSAAGDPAARPAVAVEVETGLGFTAADLAALRARGLEVQEVAEAGGFGRVHAVRWHPETRMWEGAADPDWEGAAVVPDGGR